LGQILVKDPRVKHEDDENFEYEDERDVNPRITDKQKRPFR
jgi:hypothetical protein